MNKEEKDIEMLEFFIKSANAPEKKEALALYCFLMSFKMGLNFDDYFNLQEINTKIKDKIKLFFKEIKEMNEWDLLNLQKQLIGKILS